MNIKSKISGLLNRIVRHGQWYRDGKFKDCQKFWSYKTFNTDVVNLGSSSGVNAFCYTNIKLKCANWAIGQNPLMGDLAILKNYYSFLREEGSTVIIPLCPFSSLSGSYVISDDRYYTLLYPSTIPSYSVRRSQQINRERRSPLSFYPLKALFTDAKAMLWHKQSQISEQQMQADAVMWMKNWMKEFSITDISYPLSLVNRDGIEDAARILNDIISFCKERKIRPVMLIPPVYHTLGEKFIPEIRRIVIESLIDKVEDKSVWFHNYMDDIDFTNDITLFQNSFLMNEKGARLFTQRVLKDLGMTT